MGFSAEQVLEGVQHGKTVNEIVQWIVAQPSQPPPQHPASPPQAHPQPSQPSPPAASRPAAAPPPSQHGRFHAVDDGGYQGKLRVPRNYTPPDTCRGSLLSSAEELSLEEAEDIVDDLDIRMRMVVADGVCAA